MTLEELEERTKALESKFEDMDANENDLCAQMNELEAKSNVQGRSLLRGHKAWKKCKERLAALEEHVGRWFNNDVENRVIAFEARIERMESKLESKLESKFEDMDENENDAFRILGKHAARMDVIEKQFKEFCKRSIKQREALALRVATLESKVEPTEEPTVTTPTVTRERTHGRYGTRNLTKSKSIPSGEHYSDFFASDPGDVCARCGHLSTSHNATWDVDTDSTKSWCNKKGCTCAGFVLAEPEPTAEQYTETRDDQSRVTELEAVTTPLCVCGHPMGRHIGQCVACSCYAYQPRKAPLAVATRTHTPLMPLMAANDVGEWGPVCDRCGEEDGAKRPGGVVLCDECASCKAVCKCGHAWLDHGHSEWGDAECETWCEGGTDECLCHEFVLLEAPVVTTPPVCATCGHAEAYHLNDTDGNPMCRAGTLGKPCLCREYNPVASEG